jgi:hypothetical protein
LLNNVSLRGESIKEIGSKPVVVIGAGFLIDMSLASVRLGVFSMRLP